MTPTAPPAPPATPARPRTVKPRPASGHGRSLLSWSVANLVIILISLVPLLWLVSLSFKTPASISDGNFWPSEWTFENYRGIFSESLFTRALINSIGIALISTLLAVVLGSMAAYAVARLDFPG
nr:hypothetical protein [Micromonospora sp. DSM 115978]